MSSSRNWNEKIGYIYWKNSEYTLLDSIELAKKMLDDTDDSLEKSQLEACLGKFKEVYSEEDFALLFNYAEDEYAERFPDLFKIICNPNQEQVERTIAYYILKKYLIKTISELDQVCFYENGVFRKDIRDIKLTEIIYGLAKRTYVETIDREGEIKLKLYTINNFKEKLIKTIIKTETHESLQDFDKDKNKINVLNGFLVLLKEKGKFKWSFRKHDNSNRNPYLSLIQFPISYNLKAENLEIDQLITDIVGFEDVPFIYEVFAYTIMPTIKYGKAFLFYGPPSTGKTTLTNILYYFLGRELIAEIELQNLAKRFQISNLAGKSLNLFDDLPERELKEIHILKRIITNENLSGEMKGIQELIKWTNTCKLIFTTNQTPKVPDYVGDEFWKRWILIPCYKKIKNINVELRDRNWSELELSGLLNQLLEAWIRLEERGGFDKKWDDIDRVKGIWNLDHNPVSLFVEECCIRKADIYIDYEMFFNALNKFREDHNGKPINKRTMTTSLKKLDKNIDKVRATLGSGYRFKGIDLKDMLKKKTPGLFEHLNSLKN